MLLYVYSAQILLQGRLCRKCHVCYKENGAQTTLPAGRKCVWGVQMRQLTLLPSTEFLPERWPLSVRSRSTICSGSSAVPSSSPSLSNLLSTCVCSPSLWLIHRHPKSATIGGRRRERDPHLIRVRYASRTGFMARLTSSFFTGPTCEERRAEKRLAAFRTLPFLNVSRSGPVQDVGMRETDGCHKQTIRVCRQFLRLQDAMLLDSRVQRRTASGIGAGVARGARPFRPHWYPERIRAGHVRSRRARCRRQCTAALPGAIPEYDPVKKEDVKQALKAYVPASVGPRQSLRSSNSPTVARRCRHRSTPLSSASWTRGLIQVPRMRSSVAPRIHGNSIIGFMRFTDDIHSQHL